MSDYYVEEIGMAGDGIVCADRSAAGLPMIVPPVRGDLDIVLSLRKENATLTAEVERLRLRPEEVRFLLGVKNFFNVHLVNDLLKRHGGGE